MVNEVTTIDTNNYADMAKAMGIAGETGSADTSKANPLPRMRLHHNNIMGMKKVGDESIEAVVVKGGSYKLERPDMPVVYSPTVEIRPFIQRLCIRGLLKICLLNQVSLWVLTIRHLWQTTLTLI